MKYANLIWQNTEFGENSLSAVNLGDNLQFLSMLYIYKKIDIDNIIHLSLNEVHSYRGEKIILPLNWNIFDIHYIDKNFRYVFSENIIPIFLGASFSMHTDQRCFNKFNIDYLNNFGPIGCRDEYVFQQLKAHGINAYCNGCMTATFPRGEITGKKVILDDVPLELLPYIPKTLLTDAECMTQQVYIKTDNKYCANDIAVKHYDYLLNSARLVVTSRLHVAIPCMARGIPVIFARKTIDKRFSFLDKLLPLYESSDFSSIDWNPSPVYYEEQKERMIEHAENMILRRHHDKKLTDEIHKFWINRQKRMYCTYKKSIYHNIDDIVDFLDLFKKLHGPSFKYILWGITDANRDICNAIAAKYPDAILTGIIDSFRTVTYAGIKSQRPDDIHIDVDTAIIVLAVGACNAARILFRHRGFSQKQYYLQADLFITDEDCQDSLTQIGTDVQQGHGRRNAADFTADADCCIRRGRGGEKIHGNGATERLYCGMPSGSQARRRQVYGRAGTVPVSLSLSLSLSLLWLSAWRMACNTCPWRGSCTNLDTAISPSCPWSCPLRRNGVTP